MTDEPKGKPCSRCGEPLSDIASQFERHCTNGHCKAIWSWELNEGQKPLMDGSRDRDTAGTA